MRRVNRGIRTCARVRSLIRRAGCTPYFHSAPSLPASCARARTGNQVISTNEGRDVGPPSLRLVFGYLAPRRPAFGHVLPRDTFSRSCSGPFPAHIYRSLKVVKFIPSYAQFKMRMLLYYSAERLSPLPHSKWFVLIRLLDAIFERWIDFDR